VKESVSPTVSVVIPAYNAADTIGAALASVLRQTFMDFEILVVDDASTDHTIDVARSVIAQMQDRGRHRILALDVNRGPAAARNRGISDARGKWLAFLDADDEWMPRRLEIQLDLSAQDREVVLFCAGTVSFGTWSRTSRFRTVLGCAQGLGAEQRQTGIQGDDDRSTIPSRRVTLADLAVDNVVAASSVLVRKAAVLSVGGFDEALRGPEDYDLWIRLVAKYQAVKLDAPLGKHREIEGSLSADDRVFLPQVLAMLRKHFSPGGSLFEFRALHAAAVATQYWHASWMAFCRGARGRALAHWCRGCMLGRKAGKRQSLRQGFALLLRYLMGTRPRF